MKSTDFKNRLREMIVSEVNNILAEETYRYGGLLNPKDFDPIDPDVHVRGIGAMTRSQLRMNIADRLKSLAKTAEDAADADKPYRMYKTLDAALEDKALLTQLIRAEIEIAEQMESIRTKGGRRATPIPPQK